MATGRDRCVSAVHDILEDAEAEGRDCRALSRLALLAIRKSRSYAPWHFLNFFPEPHQHRSFRPGFGTLIRWPTAPRGMGGTPGLGYAIPVEPPPCSLKSPPSARNSPIWIP